MQILFNRDKQAMMLKQKEKNIKKKMELMSAKWRFVAYFCLDLKLVTYSNNKTTHVFAIGLRCTIVWVWTILPEREVWW